MRLLFTPTYNLLNGFILSLGFAVSLLFWLIYFPVSANPTPGLDGDRVVVFSRRVNEQSAQVPFSRSNLEMLGTFDDIFESVAGLRLRNALVSEPDGYSESLPAAEVSPDFFKVFGVEAGQWNRLAAGPGARDLVALSGFASGRLGLEGPGAVGSTIRVDGRSVQVAGVLPEGVRWPGFLFPEEPQVFLLWKAASDSSDQQPAALLAARLAGGQKPSAALAALSMVLRVDRSGVVADRIEAKTLDAWVRQSARWLSALFLAGMVLLSGVFLNVVVLLLAQTLKKIDNWTVRRALGAGEARLLLDLAKRLLVLSLPASCVGLGLAFLFRRLVLASRPGLVPPLAAWHVAVVAMSALALALVAALFCGSAPLLVIRRTAMSSLLTSAATESPLGRRMGRVLVFSELIATCCLLVIGVAVVRSYLKKETLDLGFDYANLLVVELDRAPWMTAARAAWDLSTLRSRLEATPFVSRTATSFAVPLSSHGSTGTRVVPWDDPNRGREMQFEDVMISPEYFATLGVPLQGRPPESGDEIAVSRNLAGELWTDSESALGRMLLVGEKEYLVTGVAGERVVDFSDFSLPAVYRRIGDQAGRFPAVLVRGDAAKERLVREIATEWARSVGGHLLVRVRSMGELRSNLLSTPRFLAAVFGLLAALMTSVALVCVFASVNREVTQRGREIAIRRALGARRWTICRQLLSEIFVVCLPAMALGGLSGFEILSLSHRQLGVQSLGLGGVAIALLLTVVAVGFASLPPIMSASGANQADLLKST